MFRKLSVGEIPFTNYYLRLFNVFTAYLLMAGRRHAGEADIFITLINWGVVHLYLILSRTKN